MLTPIVTEYAMRPLFINEDIKRLYFDTEAAAMWEFSPRFFLRAIAQWKDQFDAQTPFSAKGVA
jgi:hypothetical protein